MTGGDRESALASGERLLGVAVEFGRELRHAGLNVGMSHTVDFVRALGALDLARRDDFKAASRAIHVRRHEDLATHDDVFESFWSGRAISRNDAAVLDEAHRGDTGRVPERSGSGAAEAQVTESRAGADERDGEESLSVAQRTYSAQELLHHKSFEQMTVDELRQTARLVDQLVPHLERRPIRRYDLHAHGTRIAARQMLRRSVATGGEMVDWLWRRPRLAPRPVTVLIDVSGSMDAYARLMLRFAHALRRANRRTEVFVFGTRLTRVTRQLATRTVDDALDAVSREVVDWSGGTRIGACLADFNRHWARRASTTDALVIVLSDGWDRGDPGLVAIETERLRRNSYRVLWLNPLAGAPGYRPLAGGMAAALKHVDVLLPAGSLADLEQFSRLLADTRWGHRPAARAARAARAA